MKKNMIYKSTLFGQRIGYVLISCLFFCMFSQGVHAQSYEQLWKEVESFQKKDLPRSAIQQIKSICYKAENEKNMPQFMKAYMTRVVEQVKLTPDSTEVEVKRLKERMESEQDSVVRALLFHLMGNITMQKEEPDWKEVMSYYRSALLRRDLLLTIPATDYFPLTVSTAFSTTYFQDNLYDMLIHQTIANLQMNWGWRKNVEVQQWIIDLYDSLIDCYGENALDLPLAAMLSHEAKILFLSQNGVADEFHLSKEQAEKSLKELSHLYENKLWMQDIRQVIPQVDADAYVDVRLKLAEILCDQQKLGEAMDLLQMTKRMYPKSSLLSDVQSKMDWILAPSLRVEIPLSYPSYKGLLQVNYKNLTEFKLDTYRLRLTPSSPELNGNLSCEVLCRSYGKKVATQNFNLPKKEDYQLHVANLPFQLPEEGIYVMKVVPVGRKGKADYRLVYVSSYQCLMVPLLDGRTEVVVVDKITGNPVPGAEVVQYQREGNQNSFSLMKVWKTDQKGSVIVHHSCPGSFFMNARTPGHDFMEIVSYYSGRRNQFGTAKEWRAMTSLFSDRALYRPGQVVHVSGIRYEQLGDSLRTLPGKVMKVELMDVNGKKVSEASATSDLFGVFSVDLTLPQQALSGVFTVRTDNKAVNIRVENYKRPTFDVEFTPINKAYTFGDQLNVEGKVQTFVGAPVRLAKGKYTLVRSEAWLWRRGGAEKMLQSGSFTTDAKGHFMFDVNLESPASMQETELMPYYNYNIQVAVTDGAGETQENVLIVPVGKRSLGIQIQGLKSKLACERKEKIQFQTMNLSKQLIKTEVHYQVFEFDDVESRKVGKQVFEGKVMSQKSFIPLEIYALPAGKYQLKASTRDDQGRLVSATQDFILFSLDYKRPPIQTSQWFYQDGTNWENGNQVSLYVGSSEPNVYLLMDVYTAQKRIRSERVLLKNTIHKFDFAYDESYGDGIVVSFAFLHDGKFYTKQVRLEKPKPQKTLNLQWESFRDELIPGQKEEWRMNITDRSGHPADVNLLAVMYDASLDQLQSHQWRFQPYFNRWLPYVGMRSLGNASRTSFFIKFPYVGMENGYQLLAADTYSRMLSFPVWNRPSYFYPTTRAYGSPRFALKSTGMSQNSVMADGGTMEEEGDFEIMEEENTAIEIADRSEAELTQDYEMLQTLRTDFSETAFYYPALRTSANGGVTISFTLPDALTEWKFMGLAHTKELDFGMLTTEVRSSKPFMVQPNLPRFIRVGDASTLAASLVNMSMETVVGKIRMELIDPMTNRVLFKQVKDFQVAEGETGTVEFGYTVVDDYDLLSCRVVADAGEFTDGEQHYLPVLDNKEWVTETIPFQVDGNGNKSLPLESLFNRQSRTATGKRLTVELTANPSWYVIQALPVVGNPSHEDAISWATAYYANALAVQLVRTHPQIQKVFETWMNDGSLDNPSNENKVETFWSKLASNADLKHLLLEETPWLAEAQTEAEQKHRMALLFELNGMNQRLALAERQLKALQATEGGWTWYPGMPVNRYTTTQIVELLARLQAMGVRLSTSMNEVYFRGLNYLKKGVKEEYRRILHAESIEKDTRSKQSTSTIRKPFVCLPSEQAIHYLYICAIDSEAGKMSESKVNAFMTDQLLKDISRNSESLSIYQKALMATIMHANHQAEEAEVLLKSVKEYLVSTPEMGTYFDTYKATYSWNSYRIPTQVAAMEAICRMSPDKKLLNGMKLWLLKQKQVQVWNTPLATVDAIYAFLLSSQREEKRPVEAILETNGKMKARLGQFEVTTPEDAMGYTRSSLSEKNLSGLYKGQVIHLEKIGAGIGWGAVYAQYFEDMNRLKKSDNHGMVIEREYWLDGQRITPRTILHTGDQLTIRLTIQVDRDMDFILIKDQRPACMEPAEQLSGTMWINGVNAYRVNRDASTEFFIDKLPKGKHQMEYNVFISRTGKYQSGSSVIQSVYTPEFTSHTEGLTLSVE